MNDDVECHRFFRFSMSLVSSLVRSLHVIGGPVFLSLPHGLIPHGLAHKP
jgi:hypothetical protein